MQTSCRFWKLVRSGSPVRGFEGEEDLVSTTGSSRRTSRPCGSSWPLFRPNMYDHFPGMPSKVPGRYDQLRGVPLKLPRRYDHFPGVPLIVPGRYDQLRGVPLKLPEKGDPLRSGADHPLASRPPLPWAPALSRTATSTRKGRRSRRSEPGEVRCW